MPISSEFITLCQNQIKILTQALGASISVVYLTKELVEGAQTQLVPIATHPESLMERERQLTPLLLPAPLTPAKVALKQKQKLLSEIDQIQPDQIQPDEVTPSLVEQRQLVVPLIHDGGVFGLLVTRRDDRAWEPWEQSQIEEIASTLALACVIDQRYLWGQQQREQERLLQRQQRDLLDNLLHQLRNSLTALHTFGKLLLKRLLPGDRTYELATNLTRETERLRELAQQMELALEIGLGAVRSLPPTLNSPIPEQLGEAQLEPTPVAATSTIGLLPSASLAIERCLVEPVLEPLLASAQTIAQEKGLTIQIRMVDDLPPIWANSSALREVLNNLIENAIKYTPTGGHISVTATAPETSSYLSISISDTGVGIPAQDLPHLFERHYRGVQAQSEIPGSGLGLAIARSLVKQMHGTIDVFSPALVDELDLAPSTVVAGAGTTFVLQLPIAEVSDQEAQEISA